MAGELVAKTVKNLQRIGSLKTVKYLDSHLKNILIINPDGLCLVAAGQGNYDPNLLAGLLIAIAHMGKEIMESEIESISFKNQRVYYIQKGGLLFVAHTSETLSEHIVFRILTEIAYTFLERYGNILPTWSGNLNTFRGFEKELEKYFDDTRLNRFINDFLLRYQAKEIALFDLKKGKVLLSTNKHEDLKEYGKIVQKFYKTTNKTRTKLPYRNIDTVILKSKNEYIVNIIREKMCLTVVFDQKNYYDLPSLTTVAEEILNHLRRMEK
ncbi:MAG: hypothetical protein ACTSSA_12025 [Candidatus Freyarchaeota archaeon]